MRHGDAGRMQTHSAGPGTGKKFPGLCKDSPAPMSKDIARSVFFQSLGPWSMVCIAPFCI
jgi:hypothetical protein